MNQNTSLSKIKAQYFDGLQSEPFFVELTLPKVDSQILSISTFHYVDISDSTSKIKVKGEIPLANIGEIEETATGLRIELKTKNSAVSAQIFIIHIPVEQRIFLQLWRKYQSEHTRFGGLKNFMQGPKFWMSLVAVAALTFVLYIQGLNYLHHITPRSYDHYLGDQAHSEFFSKLPKCESPELVRFFEKSEDLLQKQDDYFPIKIHLVNDHLVNAMALPGGNVYVFKGLIEKSNSPEEVLGVLAHEIAHVENRHSVQNLQKSTGTILLSSLIFGTLFEGVEILEMGEVFTEILTGVVLMKFSREFEVEADAKAVERLQRVGLSVSGMKDFFMRMSHGHESSGENPKEESKESPMSTWASYVSTHPSHQDRIQRFDSAIKKQEQNGEFKLSEQALQKSLFLNDIHWDNLKMTCPESKPFNWKDLFEFK
mgnify:CR=1 FL=1